MMYVDCHVGRFIETRWVSPIGAGEVDRFVARTASILRGPHPQYVVFADLENASILPPEWIDRVVDMLRADNGRIERNGMLLKGNATFVMQMERMVRQAENPSRRTFRDFNELKAWLTPVLSVEERTRFDAFRAASHGALMKMERPL